MNNNIWILLYVTLLIAVVFFEYKNSNNEIAGTATHKYKIEQNKDLDSLISGYISALDLASIDDKQWGILPKKVKKVKKEENLIKENNTIQLVEVTLKEKTLCIEQECFKLLGFFQKEQQDYASFYNEKSKEKVQSYLVGNIIDRSIQIKSIMKKSIVFSDVNSTREWNINLFDVNSSKYKPKDFK
ncbi:MAG: hypothetical protein U9O64_03545 [Campylobacterota bacterium]|nr:hypothetical protein [Campylobacterota bacterium]